VDWTLFHAVNSGVATREWLEDPTTALAGMIVPLYALATVGLWFLARPYGPVRWKLASASAVVAAGVAQLANQAITHHRERPRPLTANPPRTHVLGARTTDPSFPSDHAAAAFAIAFAVLAFSRRAGAVFLAVAALIGLSRIALGMHYPSDVLAGLLVGLAAAALVTRAGRPWIDRLVVLVSRVSDPLLRPVWGGARRIASSLRIFP
jgi:membrane-associated phospholipid phosphatase